MVVFPHVVYVFLTEALLCIQARAECSVLKLASFSLYYEWATLSPDFL